MLHLEPLRGSMRKGSTSRASEVEGTNGQLIIIDNIGAPPDKYNAVFIVFLLYGVGIL